LFAYFARTGTGIRASACGWQHACIKSAAYERERRDQVTALHSVLSIASFC
jgi:hypothetical protein